MNYIFNYKKYEEIEQLEKGYIKLNNIMVNDGENN